MKRNLFNYLAETFINNIHRKQEKEEKEAQEWRTVDAEILFKRSISKAYGHVMLAILFFVLFLLLFVACAIKNVGSFAIVSFILLALFSILLSFACIDIASDQFIDARILVERIKRRKTRF
jgi:predicted membrane channel-forming protein YqfA (hemolysin III family)